MNKHSYLITPLVIIGLIYCAINVSAEYYYNQPIVNKLNNQVKSISKDISKKKEKINSERSLQKKYASELRKKQLEKATLKNELALLDNRIKKTELDIEDLRIDIDLTQLEIQKTETSIEIKNKDIERAEKNLNVVLRSLYKEGDNNILEILLLNENLSNFLTQLKYLEDVNNGIERSLKDLERNKADLEIEKDDLAIKNKQLENFKKDLSERLETLEAEKKNKKFILEQTQNSEKKFQNLIKLAKDEQRKAQQEILSLEFNARQKLAQIEKNKIQFNDHGFIWPVPKNKITAYFHDKSYPYRYIFEHPAVDIRAKQSTTLRASASGYVARARDAGRGYSYIMIVHGDGLSTVYGHVSRIDVKEDEYVTQGQIIGLSGGMPGTRGAGRFTTGPHLHFEIRLNGIPVNPLGYLP